MPPTHPSLLHTLALAALLPLARATADDADGTPWQPVRTLLEPASAAPQEPISPQPVPPHSALRCVGVDVDSRACHFKNLYFDRTEARFVVFSTEPSAASAEDAYDRGSRSARDGDILRMTREDPPVRPVRPVLPSWAPAKPFLQLGGCAPAHTLPLRRATHSCMHRPLRPSCVATCRKPWYRDEADKNFHVMWVPGGVPPEGSGVCVVAEPTHIRSPKRLRSFGHMLRDNMAALLAVPERLGVDAERYTWLQWPTGEAGSIDDKVYQKYKGWVGDIETLTWEAQLAKCDASGAFPPRP